MSTAPFPPGAFVVEVVCPTCRATVSVADVGIRGQDALDALIAAARRDCPHHALITAAT